MYFLSQKSLVDWIINQELLHIVKIPSISLSSLRVVGKKYRIEHIEPVDVMYGPSLLGVVCRA